MSGSTASGSQAPSAATSTPSTRWCSGLIPDCDLDAVASVGNAAGAGARIALLDATARTAIEDLVRRVEKIETAIEPRFQAHFVEAMAIPHKTADYPELRKVVALPAAKESAARGATRGRRKR